MAVRFVRVATASPITPRKYRPAYRIVWPFAVIRNPSDSNGGFNVTHVPSGYAVLTGLAQDAAEELTEHLAATPVESRRDWLFRGPSVPEPLNETLRNRIREWRFDW